MCHERERERERERESVCDWLGRKPITKSLELRVVSVKFFEAVNICFANDYKSLLVRIICIEKKKT